MDQAEVRMLSSRDWRYVTRTSRGQDGSRERGEEDHGPGRACLRRHHGQYDQERAGYQQGVQRRVSDQVLKTQWLDGMDL